MEADAFSSRRSAGPATSARNRAAARSKVRPVRRGPFRGLGVLAPLGEICQSSSIRESGQASSADSRPWLTARTRSPASPRPSPDQTGAVSSNASCRATWPASAARAPPSCGSMHHARSPATSRAPSVVRRPCPAADPTTSACFAGRAPLGIGRAVTEQIRSRHSRRSPTQPRPAAVATRSIAVFTARISGIARGSTVSPTPCPLRRQRPPPARGSGHRASSALGRRPDRPAVESDAPASPLRPRVTAASGPEAAHRTGEAAHAALCAAPASGRVRGADRRNGR